MKPYTVVQFENGKYGVKDVARNFIVAAGMSEERANEWCLRLIYRHHWGG